MNYINRIFNVLKSPRRICLLLLNKFGSFLNDENFVKIHYWLSMGKKLNLKNPQTYNEKLNWIKLYDHNPLYTVLVDKFEVKAWIANQIGSQYIIPTIGVWNKAEDIDWESLPNQFVLKTTHGGCGDGVVVCKNKNDVDKSLIISKLSKSLKTNPYLRLREWPYKNVKPRIIAEVYLEDSSTRELRDYKFFCFNGEVKTMFVATERQKEGEEVKFDYFDANFNHLDLRQRHPMSETIIQKPSCFEQMKDLSSKLSKGLTAVRCDFYEVNGKVYFGELTFFHHGANTPFYPESWDLEWGKWIKLPTELK